MKEFDLEKALSGESVRLRDGHKLQFVLKGAILSKYGDDLKMEEACSWKANGSYSYTQSPKDIVGLWKE